MVDKGLERKLTRLYNKTQKRLSELSDEWSDLEEEFAVTENPDDTIYVYCALTAQKIDALIGNIKPKEAEK